MSRKKIDGHPSFSKLDNIPTKMDTESKPQTSPETNPTVVIQDNHRNQDNSKTLETEDIKTLEKLGLAGGKKKSTPWSNHVFTRKEKYQICVWYAEVRPLMEIVKLVESEFGKKVSPSVVAYYKSPRSVRWSRLIKLMRDRLVNQLTDIPIANKDIRLSRLEKVYLDAMKDRVIGYSKRGDPIIDKDRISAAMALRDARREMEGDKPINFNFDNSRHVHISHLAAAAKIAYESKMKENRMSGFLELATGKTEKDSSPSTANL